ncbi:hydroxymethylbilane synthase [Actinomyces gaoshouyii]|uniref:Hydroxymethylbilane synthase n=1 Tax=Actinomyces gaoshouyii TaxID=1960083 RepID=A0A8H9H7E8_9ACTO|nr:hydroxymethylbilane synthase [Actinomyces gaoshouyii]ARD42558.1 hydroxymethylbilane synthase [Actinomyces gaoshouyii]GGO95289.1 porphobilinogen deaminase [Actinomyces gaoshouyii]
MTSAMPSSRTIRLGTRTSALATAQSGTIARALERAAAAAGERVRVELVPVRTQGDVDPSSLASLGGTGAFAAALRMAVLDGRCDLAVHSFKDLPTAPVDGLRIWAVPQRDDPFDALCARNGWDLDDLPRGARVGTGSPRRAAQLLLRRPDLRIVDIRGNVPTRLSRVLGAGVWPDGPLGVRRPDLDGVVLAMAGLIRLGLTAHVTEAFDEDVMLPAAAQGALAVEARIDADPLLTSLLATLDHAVTRAEVVAERAVMEGLEAGCAAPVGVLAQVDERGLLLDAAVISVKGTEAVRSRLRITDLDGAEALGHRIASDLLGYGAGDVADLRATKPHRPEAGQ